jgi:hypothetical protein
LIEVPNELTGQTFFSVIEFANSILNLNAKEAFNAVHLAASGPFYAITHLALGILGLISPHALQKTAEKVKAYLNSLDSLHPPEPPKIDGLQGWKKRIMRPLSAFR